MVAMSDQCDVNGYGGGGNSRPSGQTSKTAAKRHDMKAHRVHEPYLEEVWADTLEDAFSSIQDLVESYRYVAIDTLLPGVVVRPTGPFENYADYNYQTLKCNVDLTRVLQLSITLSDESGVRPKGISTWRFNFAFDSSRDFLVQDMHEVRGLDLDRQQTQGIDSAQFGELLMSSGLVLDEDVKWIVFLGSCDFSARPPEERIPGHAGGEQACVTFNGMYNFAYLLQLLTSEALPDEIRGFRESLDLFFPSRCDLAAHVHQLPPRPPLSGRDFNDPLRRPLFCGAQHVLEAFFQLPEVVRSIAFDRVEQPAVTASGRNTQSRRCGDDANESNNPLKKKMSAGAMRVSA